DLAKAADATAEAAAIGAPGSGDLEKAADAAADIAAVTAAPPATGKASSDDIDLASLGLDPSAAAFDDKLNIYGFADVSYYAQHFVQPLPTIAQDTRTFEIGNLNLYLAKNLT